MIKVSVFNEDKFSIDETSLKRVVSRALRENGIPRDAECSVAIVKHKDLVKMAMKYLKESQRQADDHPVLSFPNTELEGPFIFPPGETVHVGEIVVSFEKAKEISEKKNISIDKIICELAEHGALHLSGVHHD